MLITLSIVQTKIARDKLTTVTTVTLKVLCTSVKREEPSKVLEEKVLTKTRVLKQNKIREHFGILREVDHCEFLSSPTCCQDGKITATKGVGGHPGHVSVFTGRRHTEFGREYAYAEGHSLGALNAE